MKTHLFLFLTLLLTSSFNQPDYSVYQILASGKQEPIQKGIEKYEQQKKSDYRDAYLGSLYMQSAQFEKTPKDKLSIFKKGRLLLEEVIAKNNLAEFRFLRLIIQENAPKILKYNEQIKTDASFIKSNFNNLENPLKEVIRNYSKTSKSLKL